MSSSTDTPTRGGLNGLLESSKPHRQEFGTYKRFIQEHYDGFAGAMTAFTGLVTGHEALAGKLIQPKAFDVRGCKRILDAACGNGRYSKFLLKYADDDAQLTSFDLSPKMLLRAQQRLRNPRVTHVVADLTRLPYADASFDAIVCGWVLEHLPDPRPGLRELARVLMSGGKMLLMCTEDTVTGAICSRLWHCRTYNRLKLQKQCQEVGLRWAKEHWFSRIHKTFHLGGIIVELRRD
jgi:ubiquinone/menaquinone biosynthesis C-methylase UbiE